MKSNPKLARGRLRWVFNALMLWGALLGFIIGMAALNLRDAYRHKGEGTVMYGDGEHSAERIEKVSEDEFKRHVYGVNGGLLVLGVFFWVVVAKSAKKDAMEGSGQ